jgi:hypothetical protein
MATVVGPAYRPLPGRCSAPAGITIGATRRGATRSERAPRIDLDFDRQEATLARAKSTARAEARRRYRASQAAVEDTDAVTDAASGGGAAAEPRRGLLGFTMPDWRGDLRAFPHELRTNRWWWISALLLLTSPIAYVIAINVREDAGGPLSLYVRLIVSPPAIPILIAGFMSKRGPYLIGFVLGIIDGLLIAAFQLASLEPGTPITSDALLASSVSILSAAVLGAGFGWIAFIYKGWLQNSSRRRIEQREKQAQEQKRKARDEARQARSGR